ncbi:hypothetical protein [Hymenobacter persicinus]|uniref:DUF6311 domain-containing protein n=1 Tax=Hymenobacter persicinus TaxID=2025506 RepID=A0A4Q5L9H0_9BACT|nr:hypothetical protein [Hymenobacter persicinus]RYU78416.1 hypothetical protein EWM57_14065 [Hymenobacter persicinus]
MLTFFRRNFPVWLLLPVALLLQLGCIFRAFGAMLFHPGQHQLVASFDGLKNYFTFQSYLQQPFEKGLGWFGNLNYPYGDYLFYTDNTPLFSLPVKLFSHYVYDLTPYGLDVYHALLLSGMLVSTALLVAILRKLLHYPVLIVFFSVVLPWLNPQTTRLLAGHYNLSLSCVMLLAIWGVLQVYQAASAGRPVWRWVAATVVGMVVAGFVHLYYLPIVGLFTGGFFLAWLLLTGKWRQWQLVLAGVLITLLPVLLTFSCVRLVDGYYGLRLTDPTGFNYAPWKMQFSALFQPYTYEKTHFIIEPVEPVSYESRAYLGAFALFGLVVAAVARLGWRTAWQQWWNAWKGTWQFRFLGLLGLASLVGLLASFGTQYSLADDTFVVNNYLSAFYYLRKITETAAHFRAVGRFQWPFFWAVNISVLVALDYWLRTGALRLRWVIGVALVLLAFLDTRDTLKHYRTSLLTNTLTNTSNQPELSLLTANLNPGQYQAILPVPFFHVGSENMDLTVDDDDQHSSHAFQLSLRTGLPLMASKMSRTPPVHARALLGMFQPGDLDSELRAKLQAAGKPVLVLLDESYYDGTRSMITDATSPSQRRIIEAGPAFIASHHLTPVAENGKLKLYRWDVQ